MIRRNEEIQGGLEASGRFTSYNVITSCVNLCVFYYNTQQIDRDRSSDFDFLSDIITAY